MGSLIDKMGRISLYTILALTVLIVIPIGVHMYHFTNTFGATETIVHHVIPSPDGRMSAIIYEVEGNATVGFNTQVSIAPTGRPFSRDKNPSFLALAGQHDLAVSWVSDKLIEIDIPESAKVYRNEPSVDGITVDYK